MNGFAVAALLVLLTVPVFDASVTLHVSARNGNDAEGQGSPEAPYRTLTRALEEAGRRGGGTVSVRIDLGNYDAAAGERFPLALPAGVTLQGLTSDLTVLDAGGAESAFEVAPGSGLVSLDSLCIRNASAGLTFKAQGDASPGLRLRNLLFDTCETGLKVVAEDAGPRPARQVDVVDSRFRGCGQGMSIEGESAVGVRLLGCLFSRSREGLLLDSNTASGKGVHHDVIIRRCLFLGNEGAAIRRSGADGLNRGKPYRIEDCLFHGAKIGIDFEQPCADSPLEVRRCRFLENELFGFRAVGRRGNPEDSSVIEDSIFRWNGVGLHLTNLVVRYRVRRNRVTDSLGNGVFFSSYPGASSGAVFSANLLADNGASGLYAIADGQRLRVKILESTITGNATSGITRRNKHRGQSTIEIRRCILAGNGVDLKRIDAGEVHQSLIAGMVFDGNDNLTGDPGFIDFRAGDYRLRPDSPCREKALGAPQEVLER